MVRPKFYKTIHLPPWPTASGICRGPRRQGHSAVAHAVGGASGGPVGLTAAGHGVRSLTLWATAVGGYRQAVAWPPGNAAGHDSMYRPDVVRCGGRIFFL
jgi:hypothetical protein